MQEKKSDHSPQDGIAESLARFSRTLSLLYEKAACLAKCYSPELDSAECDLLILSHCVRELMNRLSDYLDTPGLAKPSESGSERREFENLREVLQRTSDPSIFSVPDNSDSVIIPADIAMAIGRIAKVIHRGNSNSQIKYSLAATGRIEDSSAVMPWKDVHSFFMKYVHLGTSEIDLPGADDVLSEFNRLENYLLNRLGHFFESKMKLLSILESANESSSNNRPSSTDVKDALSLTGQPVLKRLFYSELNNPEWLHELKQSKVFKPNKVLQARQDHFPDWPEAIYLEKMAAINPSEVSAAVLEACEFENPVVRSALIRIIVRLPIEAALEPARMVVAWAKGDYVSDGYFWAEAEVGNLIRKLMGSEQTEAISIGKALFVACFEPRMEQDDFFLDTHSLISRDMYSACLGNLDDVVESMRLSLRMGIFGSFAKKLLINRKGKIISSLTIASVEEAVEAHSTSIENEIVCQIVRSIRSGFDENVSNCIELVERKHDNPIISRCAMFVELETMNKCVNDNRNLNECISKHVRATLISDYIVEDQYDPELYPLFPLARKLGVISAEEIDECVIRGCKRKRIQYLNSNSWLPDATLSERMRRWLHRSLSLIGRDSLGEKGKEILDNLSKDYPDSRYSVKHITETEIRMGPSSPVSAQAMSEMDVVSLIQHLLSWHPTQYDLFNSISHQGQGRELTRAVGVNPFLLVGQIDQISLLRVTYQRAVINGFKAAIDQGKDIPLDDALHMIELAAGKSDIESWEGEGDAFEDDCNNLELRKSAVDLADALLRDKGRKLSDDQAGILLRSLLMFAESSQPDSHYENRYGGDNMDPLTLAINTIRPSALLAIAKWLAFYPGKEEGSVALSIFVHCAPPNSESCADSAALGWAIPYLLHGYSDWLQEHYCDFLGSTKASNFQQIVLTTILAVYHPSAQVFDFLSCAMLAALKNDAESYTAGFTISKKDCLTLIGEWVYTGYVMGFVDVDHPIMKCWRKVADAAHLGNVLNHICYMVSDGNGVPSDAVRRIGALWDYHSQVLVERKGNTALSGVSRLVLSGLYSADWWGPRFLREMKINPQHFYISMFEESLIELSGFDAELAVSILFEMANCDPYPISDAYESIGIQLLAAERVSNNGCLSEVAQRCMNKLGSFGCIHLDEQINSPIPSTI